MNSPQIKSGDAQCIALIAVVSFLVGSVMTFSVMTILGASSGDGTGKISQVRYEQNMFLALECGDEGHGKVDDKAMYDPAHGKVCDEMRRIAEAAVERYHPKAGD